MAIAVGILPFVLLETALSVFDIGATEPDSDPLVGFSSLTPLFEHDVDGDVFRSARSRRLFFGPQQFAAKKPADGFRVFCLGGSTVRGRPFETDTAFAKWLELELADCDPKRHYEVVNCGGLSYASYRLTRILEEVLQYQPDLIVIATGHNEFLEDRTYQSIKTRSAARVWIEERLYSLRTVQIISRLSNGDESKPGEDNSGRTVLPDTVKTRLDEASGYASYHRDEKWRTDVVAHFEKSIRNMIDMCRQKGIPVMLVGLGSNLMYTPPFKSEHRSGESNGKPKLTADEERRWQAVFDEATNMEAGDLQQAIELYRQAEAIDAEHALLLFRMGRCLERLGQSDEAREYYIRAKDQDICPLRMLEDMGGILKAVARETDTPLIDARRMFEEQSPDQIPGNDWYTDHVHPTLAAHQQIAQAISAEMRRLNLPDTMSAWSNSQRRSVYRRHFDRLGPVYLANGRQRIDWLENWARRQRLHGETLPKDPAAHLRHGYKQLDFGEVEQAWEHFNAALVGDVKNAHRLLEFALKLFQQGRAGAAADLVERLRKHSLADTLRPELDMSSLVVALELGDVERARGIYNAGGLQWNGLTPDANAWLKAMPDALDRCRDKPVSAK
ncbi:MAG: tetratricopeptide repeat protein [Planctomycetaceae bacterium]|nr:tetratricopeptide repeat protein [Planctomycetaceae bacterium]